MRTGCNQIKGTEKQERVQADLLKLDFGYQPLLLGESLDPQGIESVSARKRLPNGQPGQWPSLAEFWFGIWITLKFNCQNYLYIPLYFIITPVAASRNLNSFWKHPMLNTSCHTFSGLTQHCIDQFGGSLPKVTLKQAVYPTLTHVTMERNYYYY